MKRTKKKLTVDAIFTADWHLRLDTPVCRTDDFQKAQWDKVRQVSQLQKKYDCPVFHAGDLFHHWKPAPELITLCLRYLPNEFYSLFGNHDLPQHNKELADKSGLMSLIESGRVVQLGAADTGFGLGFDSAQVKFHNDRLIGIAHVYTYAGKPPFPGAELEPEGNWLLDEYPKFDVIATGDNHIPFVVEDEGRLLINSGSLTRQTAKQISHRPRVYLYNSRKNKTKPHYLKIKNDVISRQHIEVKEERDERISAFVERLGTEWEADLNFEENLKRFAKENNVEEEIMNIAYKALEEK